MLWLSHSVPHNLTHSRGVWGGLLMALGGALVGLALLPRPMLRLDTTLLPLPKVGVQGHAVEAEGRDHVDIGTPIVYQNRPPSSGPHYPRTLRYGVLDRDVEPGYWVHNLEHGGIVVLYNCAEPCPALVRQLREVYAKAPPSERYHVVKLAAVPDHDMDHQLAVVAWGYIDEMDAFDADRILAFYREHVDRGPEDAL